MTAPDSNPAAAPPPDRAEGSVPALGAGAAPTAPAKPAVRAGEPAVDENIKDTLQSIIIAIILAFVFRAYVVEAFVIPTGSMAPTLLGQHFTVSCSQCGHRFAVDPDDRIRRQETRDGRVTLRPFVTVNDAYSVCPMCHHPQRLPYGTRTGSGDRILVHKYIYSLVEPRRWDVVVFKNPQQPDVNFIKRLIGLPGDSIWIIDGDIYVGRGGQWGIARKGERPKVQRALWQPIYHSDRLPLDGGGRPLLDREFQWSAPWRARAPEAWRIEGRRSYHYDGHGDGVIQFDFARAASAAVTNWYTYNQRTPPLIVEEPIEDVRLAARIQPEAQGVGVTLSTTARLDNGPGEVRTKTLRARVEADGQVTLQTTVGQADPPRVLATGRGPALRPGRSTAVELWYVDREALVWVDGQVVARHAFDFATIEQVVALPPAPAVPNLAIEVSGGPAWLHAVEVDRDVFYSSRQAVGRGTIAHGGLVKRGQQREGQPIHLEADQFFCLGDNSPMSHDSRFWDDVDPWIRRRMLSQNTQQLGVVPRKLMMGRAFFVYWPAPYSLHPGAPSVIPNFGDLRFIH